MKGIGNWEMTGRGPDEQLELLRVARLALACSELLRRARGTELACRMYLEFSGQLNRLSMLGTLSSLQGQATEVLTQSRCLATEDASASTVQRRANWMERLGASQTRMPGIE